ncbi:putative Gly-X carboxypeptidase [Filobasidium floriforme]|uniref:putative Gly-X carboxypeptidase n=1 Tax=Filobasidium floriforme TaxID=5210 RepID=UPI001E8D4CF7|nr:putative Gly-X carboxypeptidase [Filobasidium floriforme]KAH8085208.1 putative Gly-X carboxypeptidase [Filobasidium floriforme]
MSAPYTDEKYPLPLAEVEAPEENEQPQPQPQSRPKHTSRLRLIILAGVLIYFVVGFGGHALKLATEDYGHHHGHGHGKESQAKCPSQPKALGKGDGWNVPDNYTDLVIGRLSRSVRVPAVSYDDMGPIGEDKRWDDHYKFAQFLQAEYPRVYDTLTHTHVNTHAHLYTWTGTNPSLQPIVLMAHEDVVPVNPGTLGQWTHPPFEGVVDDEWVWGRGAADCKNQLMGIMSALDKLIEEGFQPERTILISFGFDEEIGGKRGANYLSRAIQEKYGKHSIAFLVDEGFGGVDVAYGKTFASLGMAEKGNVDLVVSIETAGGHSSVPPEHTGIGLLAQAINKLESHPFPTALTSASPYLKYLTCLADYAPDLPKDLRKSIKTPSKWKKLAAGLSKDPQQRAFLGTTQAVDLIKGGVKVNALPEEAEATVNYRIDFTSSVAETKAKVTETLLSVAHKYDLEFVAFNQTQKACKHRKSKGPYRGKMRLEVGNENPAGLEPAPITPSDGESFQLMGATIKKIFGDDVVVAPSAMFANTDTRAYWNVTQNLYRFAPAAIADFKNPHTVDERMSIRGHLSTIKFFYQLLQNTQGWRQGQEE